MFQNITQIATKVIVLNDSKWRRMALSCSIKLSSLLRGITSKHNGDFYFLICLNSFATEKNLNHIKKVCKNKDFLNIFMTSEDIKIL